MLKKLIMKNITVYNKIAKSLEHYLSDVWDLSIRVYLFSMFFASGWLKFVNAINGQWSITVYLFKHEHPVPFVPAEVAAILGTFNEIFFSLLLLLGLGSRCSALILLLMTAIIEFSYSSSIHHILWFFLLFSILIKGPGKLACDYIIGKYLYKNYILNQ
jgi:putative oxidoreductase